MTDLTTLIFVSLFLLGALTAHVSVERSIFHGVRSLADPTEFHLLLADIIAWPHRPPIHFDALRLSWSRGKPLGWLQPLLEQANGDYRTLATLCHRELRDVNRYTSALLAVMFCAPSIGFLGTVLSFVLEPDLKGELSVLISVGLTSTMWGIIVSTPAGFMYYIFHGRRCALSDQIDAVLWTVQQAQQHVAENPRPVDVDHEKAAHRKVAAADDTSVAEGPVVTTEPGVDTTMAAANEIAAARDLTDAHDVAVPPVLPPKMVPQPPSHSRPKKQPIIKPKSPPTQYPQVPRAAHNKQLNDVFSNNALRWIESDGGNDRPEVTLGDSLNGSSKMKPK